MNTLQQKWIDTHFISQFVYKKIFQNPGVDGNRVRLMLHGNQTQYQ